METETTTPTTDSSFAPPAQKKNTFLLVICILTFIGSGFGILGGLFSLTTADTVASMRSQYQEQLDNQNTPSFFKSIFRSAAENSDPSKIRTTAMVALLSNLLSLFGAILMLKLKRTGFYLYVLGILIYIIMPIVFIGGFLGTVSAISDGLIGGTFITMYAVNLKHMNIAQG